MSLQAVSELHHRTPFSILRNSSSALSNVAHSGSVLNLSGTKKIYQPSNRSRLYRNQPDIQNYCFPMFTDFITGSLICNVPQDSVATRHPVPRFHLGTYAPIYSPNCNCSYRTTLVGGKVRSIFDKNRQPGACAFPADSGALPFSNLGLGFNVMKALLRIRPLAIRG